MLLYEILAEHIKICFYKNLKCTKRFYVIFIDIKIDVLLKQQVIYLDRNLITILLK